VYVLYPVVDQAEALVLLSGANATATVVTHDHDLANLQNVDGKLQNGQTIEVALNNEIRDIPMREHLAGREIEYLISRDAAVRATDPQISRRLLPLKPTEKLRTVALHLV